MNKIIFNTTLNKIQSALFIQPHPDDNEIGAGGTIALLRKNGVKVYGLSVTKGEGGSNDSTITSDKVAEIRQAEADNAMKLLDMINLGSLNYNEMTTIPHDQLVNDIVRILRKIKVDAVFSVDPTLKNELHPTHIQVGNAVSEAFMRCGILHFPADNKIHKNAYTLKMLGYYLTGCATTIVNISDVMDIKIKAVKAHKSQVNEEMIEAVYALAKENAQQYSFPYAEPLRLLGPIQTHCIAIPEVMQNDEPVVIYP